MITLDGEATVTVDTGETVSVSGTVDTYIVGTYTVTYTSTDASGNDGTATRTVRVVEPVTQSLYLNKGWNLVSFYVKPADFSIENIFNEYPNEPEEIKGGVSYSRDEGDLKTTLKVSEAYWIKVSKSFTINVIGVVPEEDVKQDLKRGLNSFDLTVDSIKNISTRLYFLTLSHEELVVVKFFSVFDPENNGLTKEDLVALGGEQEDFDGIGTNDGKITFGELLGYINSTSGGQAVLNNLSEITKVVKEFFSVFATESDGLTLKDLQALGGKPEDFINIDTNGNNTISPREVLIFLNSSNNDDDEGGLEFLKEGIKIGKIVREFFSVFDPENDGLTNVDRKALGTEQQDFNNIDINDDGKITFRELITFIFSDDRYTESIPLLLKEYIRVAKLGVNLTISTFDTSEDAEVWTAVGTIRVEDNNPMLKTTLTIEGDDSNYFTLGGDNFLYLKKTLDFEEKQTLKASIKATTQVHGDDTIPPVSKSFDFELNIIDIPNTTYSGRFFISTFPVDENTTADS